MRHNYDKPITLKCPMITSYEASSSVQLPEAYILMPQWTDVIELLDLHDIKYTRLAEPKQVEVETYRYTKATFSPRQSEGRIPVLKTEYTTQKEILDSDSDAMKAADMLAFDFFASNPVIRAAQSVSEAAVAAQISEELRLKALAEEKAAKDAKEET